MKKIHFIEKKDLLEKQAKKKKIRKNRQHKFSSNLSYCIKLCH